MPRGREVIEVVVMKLAELQHDPEGDVNHVDFAALFDTVGDHMGGRL